MASIQEYIKNNQHQYDKRVRGITDQGRIRINDLIAPDVIKIEPTHIQVGSRYVRTIFVTGYPRESYMGWLNRLYSFGENIDISIHIEPLTTEKVIKDLTKKITQLTTTEEMERQKRRITDIAVTSARDDALSLRDALHHGHEKLFYQAIYISVSGSTLEELNDITEKVETLCGTLGLNTRQALFQQEPGFTTTLPLGQDRIGEKRNFITSSLADCIPFTSAELTNMEGTPILYGIDMINGSLVMFDRFKLNNYNSVVLATPGMGKSYFAKLESLRYMGLGANVIIIDPNGEYGRLAEHYGGQNIKLHSGSKQRLNPLDIESTEEEEGRDFLTQKILNIATIIEVMLDRKLEARERKILLDAAEETYAKFGITRDKNSLYEEDEIDFESEFFELEAGTKKMPTLSDLEATLRQGTKESIDLADQIEPYTSGVLDIFNGETNVDLDSNFIVFDIKDMESQLEPLAMFVCLEFIWNKIKRDDGKKRLLIVDEAWTLMKNESSADYMVSVAKQARKFHAGLTVISQQVDDFINYGGAAIIDNSSMQVLLRQGPQDLRKISDIFMLSRNEQSFLQHASIGEALIFAGGNHTAVQVVSHQFEHLLCDTTPENREIIKEMLRDY